MGDRAVGRLRRLLALALFLALGERCALRMIVVVIELYFLVMVAAADEGENGDGQSSQGDEESAHRTDLVADHRKIFTLFGMNLDHTNI